MGPPSVQLQGDASCKCTTGMRRTGFHVTGVGVRGNRFLRPRRPGGDGIDARGRAAERMRRLSLRFDELNRITRIVDVNRMEERRAESLIPETR